MRKSEQERAMISDEKRDDANSFIMEKFEQEYNEFFWRQVWLKKSLYLILSIA